MTLSLGQALPVVAAENGGVEKLTDLFTIR